MCNYCGADNTAFFCASDNTLTPAEGDINICAYCGEVSVFEKDGSLTHVDVKPEHGEFYVIHTSLREQYKKELKKHVH